MLQIIFLFLIFRVDGLRPLTAIDLKVWYLAAITPSFTFYPYRTVGFQYNLCFFRFGPIITTPAISAVLDNQTWQLEQYNHKNATINVVGFKSMFWEPMKYLKGLSMFGKMRHSCHMVKGGAVSRSRGQLFFLISDDPFKPIRYCQLFVVYLTR